MQFTKLYYILFNMKSSPVVVAALWCWTIFRFYMSRVIVSKVYSCFTCTRVATIV